MSRSLKEDICFTSYMLGTGKGLLYIDSSCDITNNIISSLFYNSQVRDHFFRPREDMIKVLEILEMMGD